MNKLKEFFINFWNKIKESKLNMGMFLSGIVAFILLVVIICIVIFRGGKIDNKLVVEDNNEQTTSELETTTKSEEDKNEEEFTTKLNENETTNVVSSPSMLSVKATVSQSWSDNGEYYIQYNLRITNISKKDINGWGLVLDIASQYELVDTWNFTYSTKNRKLVINPLNDYKEIEAGESVTIGFIIKGSKYVYIDYYTTFVGNKIETVKNSNNYIPQTTTPKETTKPKETTTPPIPEETTTLLIPEETTTLLIPEETTTSPISEETTTPPISEETTTTSPPPIPESTTPVESPVDEANYPRPRNITNE